MAEQFNAKATAQEIEQLSLADPRRHQTGQANCSPGGTEPRSTGRAVPLSDSLVADNGKGNSLPKTTVEVSNVTHEVLCISFEPSSTDPGGNERDIKVCFENALLKSAVTALMYRTTPIDVSNSMSAEELLSTPLVPYGSNKP